MTRDDAYRVVQRNAQRMQRRRAAHEDGAWVREAATAYARRAEVSA